MGREKEDMKTTDDSLPKTGGKKTYYILLDGNDTEAGRQLRAEMERMNYMPDTIEDHVQVQHTLSFIDGTWITYQHPFNFIFRRVKLFVHELQQKGIPIENIIEYLKYVKRENLHRRERYVSDKEIEEEKIPADQLVTKQDVKLFEENVNVEIKYLKKQIKNKAKGNIQINIQKIQWKTDDTELYYLLDLLQNNGHINEIDKKTFFKIIQEYFIDKNGNPFKDKRIDQAISNMKYTNKSKKPRNSDKIESVVKKLQKTSH